MRIKTFFALVFYYGFAKFLPETNNRYIKFPRNIRAFLGKILFDKCGKHITIERGANFGTGAGIRVGDNSGIGLNAYIRGPLDIGDDVLMGPDVVIMTTNHNYNNVDIPIRKQGSSLPEKVVIGNDCWIGTRSIILPGVKLGNGCVVAAGSVVTKSFDEKSVIGGVPAKLIKKRGE